MIYIDKLLNILKKRALTIDEFNTFLLQEDRFFSDIELEKELIISNGFPLLIDNEVLLKTILTKISNQVFCVVDIETTASDVTKGQIIEIGALKYKNGKVIETYKSFANANNIPKNIEYLTGITMDMLKDAPNLKDLLEEFKIFLEDDIFVAHNVNFDYKFISDSFKQYSLGELCNRKLCTIDLASKTIPSQKYGMKYLKQILNIDVGKEHRAYNDALACMYILDIALKKIPSDIIYTEDLISFSKVSCNK